MAEREGFEPPDPRRSTVFKTAAIDRSAISPVASISLPHTLLHTHYRQTIRCKDTFFLGMWQKTMEFSYFCTEYSNT